MTDLIIPHDDLERCQCHYCGTVFYNTKDHFSSLFCSEECLDMFYKDTIEKSKLLVELLKMSQEHLKHAQENYLDTDKQKEAV